MPTVHVVFLKLFAGHGTGRTDKQSSDYKIMLPPLRRIKNEPRPKSTLWWPNFGPGNKEICHLEDYSVFKKFRLVFLNINTLPINFILSHMANTNSSPTTCLYKCVKTTKRIWIVFKCYDLLYKLVAAIRLITFFLLSLHKHNGMNNLVCSHGKPVWCVLQFDIYTISTFKCRID